VQQLEIDQSLGPMQGLPNSPATMVTPFSFILGPLPFLEVLKLW